MSKMKDFAILASRTKSTDKGPMSAADAMFDELRAGATIVEQSARLPGEVIYVLTNDQGTLWRRRVPGGLNAFTPDQLLIVARALKGETVRGKGRPITNAERDAWLRGTTAMYHAAGHPLKFNSAKKSAFELASDEAAECGIDVSPELVEKIWEAGTAKRELKNATKLDPQK